MLADIGTCTTKAIMLTGTSPAMVRRSAQWSSGGARGYVRLPVLAIQFASGASYYYNVRSRGC